MTHIDEKIGLKAFPTVFYVEAKEKLKHQKTLKDLKDVLSKVVSISTIKKRLDNEMEIICNNTRINLQNFLLHNFFEN